MIVHTLWIVPLVLLIVFLSSPRFRGDIAQTRVRRILATGLEKNRYTVFNNITFPSGGGTVHIDHLVISRFGIFVIKSLYVKGSISGGEFQDRWKLHHWGRITRIDNPMHRNKLQVDALQKILQAPSRSFHPMVVLVGQKGFNSSMPERVLPPENLLAYLRKRTQQKLDGEQADQLIKTVETTRIGSLGESGLSSWRLLQWGLCIILLAGIWFAFGDQVKELQQSMGRQGKADTSPELFHPDGTEKTEREIWEDSLVCASSSDSGRCACYEPGGSKVNLDPEKCRSLAERGSVLKQ